VLPKVINGAHLKDLKNFGLEFDSSLFSEAFGSDHIILWTLKGK